MQDLDEEFVDEIVELLEKQVAALKDRCNQYIADGKQCQAEHFDSRRAYTMQCLDFIKDVIEVVEKHTEILCRNDDLKQCNRKVGQALLVSMLMPANVFFFRPRDAMFMDDFFCSALRSFEMRERFMTSVASVEKQEQVGDIDRGQMN